MIAYKGFRKTEKGPMSVMGHGSPVFTPGVWYAAKNAKTASGGYHCCENPLTCCTYYPYTANNEFYAVEAAGDIDEDDTGKIACTRMRLIKRLDTKDFLLAAARYAYMHPEREWPQPGSHAFWIDRSKSPKGAAAKGAYILLLKEQRKRITAMNLLYVDGEKIKPDTMYDIDGNEVER